MLLSGLRGGVGGVTILAFTVLCCRVAKPGPIETQTLIDYSEKKEEFLEEYVMSGWMKEWVVQRYAGGWV